MAEAAIPVDEAERLAALQRIGVLDQPPEERFDRITRTASRLIGVPIALISLVDVNRQWFASCFGTDLRETPRTASFCAHAILQDVPLVIEDATRDPRFADNPLVLGEPHVRAYAGRVITGPEKRRLGTLCLIDTKPRGWSSEDLAALEDLAAWAEMELTSTHVRERARLLELSEARVRAIMESSADGIMTTDLRGDVEFANPSAAEMLQRSLEEVVGRSFHELMHRVPVGMPTHSAEDCPTIHQTLQAGLDRRGVRETLWRRDGSTLALELSITPMHEGGEIRGGVVSLRDVTERRELDRMKEQFVSSVSHELRTPLTSIRGFLEAVLTEEAGPVNDEQREYLEIVSRNVKRLHALIDDLLLLSRMNSGRIRLQSSEVRLDVLLGRLAVDLAPSAAERSVVVTVEASDGLLVEGSELRLQQAFANLLSNAIKFSPPGGEVKVEAGQRDGEIYAAVRDEGVGIPADELPKLSQRFFRASTAGATEGTGLGLAITREIVELHGGRLEITSVEGQGSTFRVLLPHPAGSRDQEGRSDGRGT